MSGSTTTSGNGTERAVIDPTTARPDVGVHIVITLLVQALLNIQQEDAYTIIDTPEKCFGDAIKFYQTGGEGTSDGSIEKEGAEDGDVETSDNGSPEGSDVTEGVKEGDIETRDDGGADGSVDT